MLGTIPALPGTPWTGLFRFARLNRMVRTIRSMQGKGRSEIIDEARDELARSLMLSTIFLGLIAVTFASFFILRFERGAGEAEILTGDVAFWWTMVTLTTVGYGDCVPVTFPGRMLAIGLMIFGFIVFAVLTSVVTTRIVVSRDDQERAIIKAELAEIKELLKQQRDNL